MPRLLTVLERLRLLTNGQDVEAKKQAEAKVKAEQALPTQAGGRPQQATEMLTAAYRRRMDPQRLRATERLTTNHATNMRVSSVPFKAAPRPGQEED